MARPSFIKRGSTRHSEEEIFEDDMDDRDDSKRRYRNLSEKKRRDQFNVLVNELNLMVSTNNRKMDKSSVLHSTISFLRNYNEITVKSQVHEIQDDWKPVFLSNVEFSHLILEALDGFILVFSTLGAILYASESITALLGHVASDLVNTSVYDLIHKSDHSQLYNILLSSDNASQTDNNDHQVSLVCHMKHYSLDDNKSATYELVRFQGHLRREQEMDCYYGSETKLVFVSIGKLFVPQLIKDLPFVDASKSEFTSRHSLEWKFLFLDHRASPIIGYLPFEVLGTSGYDYYHVDDLDKIVECHQALIQKGECTSCHYRFLMKGQQWIWLQTRFYITYHQWTSKPEFIACSHRVVSNKDLFNHKQSSFELKTSREEALTNSWPNKTTAFNPEGMGNSWPSVQEPCKQGMSDSMSSNPENCKKGMFNLWSNKVKACNQGASNKAEPYKQEVSKSWLNNTKSSKEGLPDIWLSKPEDCKEGVWSPSTASKLVVQSETASTDSRQSQLTTRSNASTMNGGRLLQQRVHQPDAMLGPHHYIPTIVMTTAQSLAQDQLQRKHQHLQQLINMQQEELRLVSEQLLMARCTPAMQPAVGSTSVLSPLPVSASHLYSVGDTSGIAIDQMQMRGHTDAELYPYQLSQHQAQVLFTPPDTTTHHDL